MNLATMRTQFKAHTSGLADQMADPDIDGYMNLIYMWVIPTEVDGSLTESLWERAIAINQFLETVPAGMVALNHNKHWIHAANTLSSPQRLYVSYDYMSFTFRWPDYRDTTKTGKPDEICIFNNVVIYNRPSDYAYLVVSQCRAGPGVLTSAGIGDDIHALATISGASWIYLQEKEDSVGAAREGGLYDIYKNLLLTRSQSRYQPRRPARSF